MIIIALILIIVVGVCSIILFRIHAKEIEKLQMKLIATETRCKIMEENLTSVTDTVEKIESTIKDQILDENNPNKFYVVKWLTIDGKKDTLENRISSLEKEAGLLRKFLKVKLTTTTKASETKIVKIKP